jgi:hypothetical protein
MHIKIIITEMKPNFLLHMLWSKKNPKKPTNPPRAIIDLDLYIYA